MELIKIVSELKSSNSRLHKEAVLRKHKDNKEWLRFLYYVYNPLITYGVKDATLYSPPSVAEPDDEFYHKLNMLASRKVSGNEARELIGRLVKWYGKYLQIILNRTLDAGVEITTINKVYGNVIPTFQVMKAKNYDEKTKQKLSFPVFGAVKYDGFNHTIVIKEGKVSYFTSSGKRFTLVDDGIFSGLDNGVFFAELIGTDGKLGDRQNCGIATTVRTNSAKGIPNHSKLRWRVFDRVSLEEFEKGVATTPYIDRTMHVMNLIPEASRAEERLLLSHEEVENFISSKVKDGWEGLVLKQPSMLWRASASRKVDFVKYKKLVTYDLKVTDVEEGEGRLEGLIGALVLSDASDRVVCRVGTGFSDSDREYDNDYINKIVEVKCERISPDGQLVQPVFLGVRQDKVCGDIDGINPA